MSQLVGPLVTPPQSNRLAVLAEGIRNEHAAVRRAASDIAQHAYRAGQMLAEAKARDDIPRYGWERWVEEEASVPYRTAAHYIQLYVAVSKGRATLQDIANAGQLAALKAATSREARRRIKAAIDTTGLPRNCTLLLRDIAELANAEPNSVDWIVTDPPYPAEYLPLYDHLARGAAHVLKPGGGLLCMTGHTYLPDVLASLLSQLRYHWILAYLTPGGQAAQIFPRRVNTFWKPVLLFSKGELAGNAWFGDVARSDPNDNDKNFHDWGQSCSGMLDLMRCFIAPGHTILDPFLGGGTTAVCALTLGAAFIGSDSDPVALDTTRERLASAEY